MKAPQKVKAKVWQIAEKEGLSDIVIGHGVDRIWELIKEETEDEIFLSYEEACVIILKELSHEAENIQN